MAPFGLLMGFPNSEFQHWPAKINCRLINPTKTNIGVISKSILDRINTELRSNLEIIQWRSSKEVLKWFFSHEDKGSLKFLKYDVEQFYHSISRPLIEKAIKFARLHTSITVRMDYDGNIWENINNPDFDVSTEVRELIAIYI